jgi:hypothetical protein
MDEHVHLVLPFYGDAILRPATTTDSLAARNALAGTPDRLGMVIARAAIVIGALEGVTDLFPVSSLGHSVIVANGLRLHR